MEGGELKENTTENEVTDQRQPTKKRIRSRPKAIRGHSRLRVSPMNDQIMERSFNVWNDFVYGTNIYDLMKKYGVSQYTIECDIKCQSELNAEMQRKKREQKTAAMIKVYLDTIKNQMRKGDMYDGIALDGGKVTDSTGSVIVAAATRLEKLLGLDQPVKVDMNFRAILDAIDGGSENGEEPVI